MHAQVGACSSLIPLAVFDQTPHVYVPHEKRSNAWPPANPLSAVRRLPAAIKLTLILVFHQGANVLTASVASGPVELIVNLPHQDQIGTGNRAAW
jgi:hypothetical protein